MVHPAKTTPVSIASGPTERLDNRKRMVADKPSCRRIAEASIMPSPHHLTEEIHDRTRRPLRLPIARIDSPSTADWMNTCALGGPSGALGKEGDAANDGARHRPGRAPSVAAVRADGTAPAPMVRRETLDTPVSNVSLPVGSGRSRKNSVGASRHLTFLPLTFHTLSGSGPRGASRNIGRCGVQCFVSRRSRRSGTTLLPPGRT